MASKEAAEADGTKVERARRTAASKARRDRVEGRVMIEGSRSVGLAGVKAR